MGPTAQLPVVAASSDTVLLTDPQQPAMLPPAIHSRVPRCAPAQLAARGDPEQEQCQQQPAMISSSIRQPSIYNISRQEAPRITAPV